MPPIQPRRTRRTTVRWAVAVVLLAAPAAAVATAAPASSGCLGATISAAGPGWLAIAPHFSRGPAGVTLVGSPQFQPDTVYASNGVEIMRSQDGGCTWRSIFEAAAAASAALQIALPQSATVTSFAAPSSANSSRYLYVGVDVTVAGVSQPIIAISGNNGATWSYADSQAGLPPVGSVVAVTATADLPLTSYAIVSTPVAGTDVSRAVYASTDGGATWTMRTPFGSSYDGTTLIAGPKHDTEVFGLSGGGVQVSEDGGATFTAVPTHGRVLTLALAVGDGGVRVAAGHGDEPDVEIANPYDANAARWTTRPSGVVADDIAYAPLQDLLAVSGESQVFLEPAKRAPLAITPSTGSVSQMGLSAPTSAGFDLTALSTGKVLRATFSPLTYRPVPVTTLRPVRLLPGVDVRQFPAALMPGPRSVTLRSGASVDLPYQLLLPRVPTPLDVMFLIDTTGSMGNVIDGLRQDLVAITNALNVSGLDVEIGLGDFKDYPYPYGGGDSSDYPYRLDARVQKTNAALQAAIGRLFASGGGDGAESGLTALYQSTTGAGDLLRGHTFVLPGQQAGYRPEVLHLAVMATDSPLHRGGEPFQGPSGKMARYPGPTMLQTVAAMLAHEVHQVGLAAANGATPDLAKVASGTHTFAPDGGVDCNGDGTIDVRAGSPLVCEIGDATSGVSPGVGVSVDGTGVGDGTGGAVSLTGAVVGLAEALPDYQPVALRVTRGASVAIVRTPAYPAVNVKADNELGYTLHLACPVGSKTRTVPVGLAATVSARAVATGAVSLTCLGAHAAPALPVSLFGAPVRGLAAAGPPAPPEPVPNVNPNPQPNPNPNPNVNANAAMAQQEQQQQQLAVAYLDGIRGQDTIQLAMSRRNRDPSSMLFIGAAGLTALAAGGIAVGRARSHRIATS